MIQFKKIITSKSVLLFLLCLTTTTRGFLQNDHRETSRRINIPENRNFPERRQVGRNLNVRNAVHRFDEKDRVYENLYDRRSFRTGTPEKSESNERRILGSWSSNSRREVRSTFVERNDNRASDNNRASVSNRASVNNRQRFSVEQNRQRFSVEQNGQRFSVEQNRQRLSVEQNRQRFSVEQNRHAENSRNLNVDNNRRYADRIDLNRENRRHVSSDARMNSQISRLDKNDFENRRQTAVDRRINSVIPSTDRQTRAFPSRSDSTRRVQNARINSEREVNRDARTRAARVTVSSRKDHAMNEPSRTDSSRALRENARIFDRRGNVNSQKLQYRQERRELFRSYTSRRMPDTDRTRNSFSSRLAQENKRDSGRNRLARVSAVRYTRREFGVYSRNVDDRSRENVSRESNRRTQMNASATQARVVPVKRSPPAVDALSDARKPANVPQLKVSNSNAVRYLPGEDISQGSADLREKSAVLQSSQEGYGYLKQNLGINSWANAAQVILGVYLLGQIFLNSSKKTKSRFHMFAVGSMKDKIH